MTGLVFKNNAKTTLSSAVNNSTTTIPVTEGSVFPACNLGSSGTFFFVTLDDDTNNEIVKVTVSSGSSGNQNLTVVRAQEGTSATAFDSGDKVELRMTAGMVDTFNLSGSDISLDSSNNRMGFGDTTPEVSLDLGSQTDSLHVPVGTTAQRPGSPEAGYLRYNSTTGKFEGYTNAWGDLADGSDFLVTNTFTTANASTTAFTISNAVQDEKQLLVFIEGVFQAHNSYSVSGTTVTLNTAPASGREVTIYSALSNLQGANMVKATMTGDNSDTTLDLGVTPVSENNVQVYFDGVYQNKDSFSISGQTLTFGVAPPTGVAVEAITHTILDVSAAASSVLIDEFTGDGSDTTFTLSAAPANENNTQVYVGGVYQEKATYSVSGTTLTFSEAPANGVSIEVMSIAVGQINSAIQLSDADGDTKVMVEESADEDKIRFDTAGSERMIISGSNVGIGTSSPSRPLEVTGSATDFSGEIKVNNSSSASGAHGSIQFVTEGENTGLIIGKHSSGFSEPDLAFVFNELNSAMQFGTNNTERMRIDSSGNLLVGQTSLNYNAVGASLASIGTFRAAVDGGLVAALNRKTSDGAILNFYKDGTGIGTIGASGGDLVMGTGDTGIHFHDGVDSLIPWNITTANYRDDAIDLGTSSYRFDDIYASSGTVNASDQNEKNTIAESDLGLDFVKKLSPKSYKFNGKTRTHYGLIAQDIETVLTDISKSTTDFAGFVKEDISEEQDGSSYRYGLRYNEFISPLIKAIQELSAKVEELEGKIN